jgi:hypothetical protein
MKINGIEGLTATQIKSEIERGAKFVTFHYCISIVVLSFKRVSEIYFIRAGESGARKGSKYTLLALLFGWWGVPFGIFWTIQALIYNLGGGNNVTKEVVAFLDLSNDESKTPSQLPTPEQVIQSSQKTCPKCAEKIQLEALVCRFCGHTFVESEVQAMKQQLSEQARETRRLAEEQAQEASRLADEEAARRKVETDKNSRIKRKRVLTITGGLLGGAGLLIGLLFTIVQLTDPTAASNVTGYVGIMVICTLPLIVTGGVLLAISRRQKTSDDASMQLVQETENEAGSIPASTVSVPERLASNTASSAKVEVTASPNSDERRISEIMNNLKTAREQHQLPELKQIVDALVAVEERTNYATLVMLALKTAAEIRGVSIGELKDAYMKLWSHWHKHPNEPKYRAEKVIVITAEAAQVHPDSEIGWMLISMLLVWFGKGCPDEANDLKKHFGNVPSLEDIRKYQGIG